MTEEQIIKALGCCGARDCGKCPYAGFTKECGSLAILALDLINRQKAGIERLLQKLQQAKSDTIKEFAEALKESADNGGCGEDFVFVSDIDILVKEMTEVQE